MENEQLIESGKKTINWKVIFVTIITLCFLAFYFSIAKNIGLSGSSGLELGVIFVIITVTAVSLALSLGTFVFVLKGVSPLIIFWCLFIDFIADWIFGFYIGNLNPVPALSHSSLPILLCLLLTVLILANRSRKDFKVRQLFLISLLTMFLIGVGCFYLLSIFSNKILTERSEDIMARTKTLIQYSRLHNSNQFPFGEQFPVTFTLDSAEATITPGQIIEFTGKITNNANEDGIYLNGATPSTNTQDLTIDASPLFRLPTKLRKGETASGVIFTVATANIMMPGDYFGTFEIQGGPHNDSNDSLGQITVVIHVINPIPAVCANEKDTDKQRDCVLNTIAQTKNPNLCQTISQNSADFSLCIAKIAQITNNVSYISYCNLIQQTSRVGILPRAGCYQAVMGLGSLDSLKKSTQACNTIPNLNNRDNCHALFAFLTAYSQMLDSHPTQPNSESYSAIREAAQTKCQPISNPVLKQWCISTIGNYTLHGYPEVTIEPDDFPGTTSTSTAP